MLIGCSLFLLYSVSPVLLPTKRLYFDNTYCNQSHGLLVHVGSNQRGTFFVFNQTIFYPQGGGQPSDTGIVQYGETKFKICSVELEGGIVRHYLNTKDDPKLYQLFIDKMFRLTINNERRMKNALMHTAAHTIGLMVEKNTRLIHKSHYCENEAFVQFEGVLSDQVKENAESVLARVNQDLTECIHQNKSIYSKFVDSKTLAGVRFPSGFRVPPQGTSCRVFILEGLHPLLCEGTHVSNFTDFISITAQKISSAKNPKVFYKILERITPTKILQNVVK
jgi:alanyl-tRNA synthetase